MSAAARAKMKLARGKGGRRKKAPKSSSTASGSATASTIKTLTVKHGRVKHKITVDISLGVVAIKEMLFPLTRVSVARQAIVARGGARWEDGTDLLTLSRAVCNGDTLVLIGTAHPSIAVISELAVAMNGLGARVAAAEKGGLCGSEDVELRRLDNDVTEFLLKLDAVATDGDAEVRGLRKQQAVRGSQLGDRIARLRDA